LKNVRESVVRFSYELRRAADGRLLATGETMHIAVDSEKKITVFPEKYMKALRAAIGKERI
jgi:acyl-CoA thioesterase FadM